MKYIFLLLVTLMATLCIAQNKDERYNTVIEYINANDLQNAYDLVVIMKEDADRNYENGSPRQLDWLYLLTTIYTKVGYYDMCESTMQNYLRFFESEAYSNWTLQYNRVENFRLWGRYMEAIRIAEPVLEGMKLAGLASAHYYDYLNQLGLLYTETGHLQKAETVFIECKDHYATFLMRYEELFQKINNNLGLVYIKMDKLEEAEDLINQCLQYRLLMHGKEAVGVAVSYHNLGLVFDIGNELKKSFENYDKAYKIRSRQLGSKHPLTIQTLNNIATVQARYGDLPTADSMLGIVLEAWEKSLGTESADYAIALSTRAIIRMEMGQFDSAWSQMNEAINIRRKLDGDSGFSMIEGYSQLGYLTKKLKKYDEALLNYAKAMSITEKNLSKNSDTYRGLLLTSLTLLDALDRKEEADGIYEQWMNMEVVHLSEYMGTVTAGKFANIYYQELSNIHEAYDYAWRNKDRNAALLEQVLNMELTLSSWQLKGSDNLLKMVQEKNDPALLELYKNWIGVRQEYADQNALIPGYRTRNTYELAAQAQAMEREIRGKLPELGENFDPVSWKNVASKLSENKVMVQFLQHVHFTDFSIDTALNYYQAIVFNNQGKLLWLRLCKRDSLENWFGSGIGNNGAGARYRGENIAVGKKEQGTKSSILYQLLWEPLMPAVNGSGEIIYTSSGRLHSLPLGAVRFPDNTFALDKFKLTCVVSLNNYKPFEKKDKMKIAVLYGGVDFDQAEDNPQSEVVAADGAGFQALPGTGTEVKMLSRLLKKNRVRSLLRTGKAATESAFKTDIAGADIIHVASHGFFMEAPNQTELGGIVITINAEHHMQTSANPMLRSGLILAGGNLIWTGKEIKGAANDGILSAYEVSNLDLKRTEMVVLSACETGLGDVSISDGVFGLQRAFKIAGVHYILVTLWQIGDETTVEFMKLFYENLINSGDYSGSFNSAVTRFKASHGPEVWGAFQLVQ